MRDLIAGIVAVLLLVVAAGVATRLQTYRVARKRARERERAGGRTIIAEMPTEAELLLFSEDADRFYYGDRSIKKDLIVAARLLINGAPIAEYGRFPQDGIEHMGASPVQNLDFPAAEDVPEGIARDRWDVAIQTADGTVLVECGAIRERVSQELARAVFEAVKRAIVT
jgi:hypothetical protein